MIIIGNSGCEKSLGVKLDWQLNFYAQISDICKIASRKLNALIRIPPFIGLSKRHILMKAFLILNLVIVLLFGCATAAQIIGK